jgi:hypothetical protein
MMDWPSGPTIACPYVLWTVAMLAPSRAIRSSAAQW